MTVRPPERDDLDALLDVLLRLAREHLRKRGEFYPFGSVMTADGEVRLVAGYTGAEHPPSQELIDVLVAGASKQAAAGEIRAVAICYDARMRIADGKATDAIAVSLEHAAGDTVLVHLPYSKGRLTGLRFGDLTASAGERRVFPSPEASDDIGPR